ncbi:MAG: GTPase Era [Actinobacteria bacterium]|nr:GTPase Era [Actinomycetota bacterium]
MSQAAQGSQVRSGFVVLAGRPNSGKSTLINAAAGAKVAIVSDRPQTTRRRLRAVIDRDDAQLVLVDTPGIHKPKDVLGERLNKAAAGAILDADMVCLVIDASQPVGRGDEWVVRYLRHSNAPSKLLVITKIDLVDSTVVQKQTEAAMKLLPFDNVIAVSAVTGFNVEGLVKLMIDALPHGPRYFPRDMASDQSVDMMISEFIREKVIRFTFDEVPHAIGVHLEDYFENTENNVSTVEAVIYVERESQKGILIGKQGHNIKRIGTEARMDLERLLGTKVFLDLKVKVKKDWRRDSAQIRRFGYGEDS